MFAVSLHVKNVFLQLCSIPTVNSFQLSFWPRIIDRFNPFHLTADMSPPDSSPEPLADPLDYDAMEDKIDKLKVKLQRLHN